MGYEQFYDKKYRRICVNIAHGYLTIVDDLHSETIISILKYGIDYDNINNAVYLFSSFAWKTFNSNSFKKKYNIGKINYVLLDIDQVDSEDYDPEADDKIDAVITEYFRPKETKKGEYLDLLHRRYLECGEDVALLSEKYNISKTTIYSGLNEIKRRYKEIYENTHKARE